MADAFIYYRLQSNNTDFDLSNNPNYPDPNASTTARNTFVTNMEANHSTQILKFTLPNELLESVTMDYENNINYDDNHSEVYGNDLSKHERFRDLGIPMFTLQLRSNQCNNNFENDNHDAQVISDEMFDKLYNLVAQSQKKETNDSKKNKEKTGPNTRKRKKVKK